MAGLTVTEKEHWKDRSDRRIALRIETITTEDLGLLERIKEQARCQAMASLGIAELDAEVQRIERQEEELRQRETLVKRTMLAQVRGVPVETIDTGYNDYASCREIDKAIERRLAVHEDRLLAEHDVGRRILALRQERERLIDTVWLATSSASIRELWTKVGELLADEPTQLEREALAIKPEGTHAAEPSEAGASDRRRKLPCRKSWSSKHA